MKSTLHVLANQILALSTVTTQPLPCLTREDREALVALHDSLLAAYFKQAETVRKSALLTPREVESGWARRQLVNGSVVEVQAYQRPSDGLYGWVVNVTTGDARDGYSGGPYKTMATAERWAKRQYTTTVGCLIAKERE